MLVTGLGRDDRPRRQRAGAGRANEESKANRFLDKSATGFEVISSPGAFIIGPALYAHGRFANHPGIEDLGWHGTEAALLGSGITGIPKGALGRSRPYVTADTNPRDFKFGRGFSGEDRSSFPSGHTTTAFAAASAVTSEVQRMWPKYTWYVAPVMYGGATLAGFSRRYHSIGRATSYWRPVLEPSADSKSCGTRMLISITSSTG